jgi:hypothetical protein
VTRTWLVAILPTIALTACATGAPGTPGASGASGSNTSSSSPYALYTHCGINEANIDGRWYEADTPLSDGNGNPPAGWGNPEQQGTVTMRSATQAEFTDAAGHRVAFTLRPGATGPEQICS